MSLFNRNVILFLFVITFHIVYAQICMDKRLLEVYKQKQCEPIDAEKNAKCPQVYKCPKTTASAPQEGCVYNNKKYQLSERVFKSNPCGICNCGSFNTISCVYSECPGDAFGVPPYPSNATQDEIKGKYKNCYYSYNIAECCGTPVCPTDDELSKMHTCTYEGKVYRKGQQIYPKDVCKACVCNETFDGNNLETAACRNVECEMNMKKVNRGCVPVNHEAHCCPIQYKCPPPNYEERQKICSLPPVAGPCDTPSEKFYFNKEKNKCETFTYNGCVGNKNNFNTNDECISFCTTPAPTGAKDEKQCHFGEKSYNVGAKLVTNNDCLECLCLIPPDITCVNRC